MRQVNSAWQVLGNPQRRATYDRQRASRRSGAGDDASTGAAGSVGRSGAVSPGGPRIERPSTAFSPYWEHDEDDDDAWRYEPDEMDPATTPSRVLLAAPVGLFAVGIILLVLSAPTGIRWFAAGGLICMLLSALLFVGAPVTAMFKSQIAEDRLRRRR